MPRPLPMWAIRTILFPNGRRWPKWVKYEKPKPEIHCSNLWCRKKIEGGVKGVFRGERWICMDCAKNGQRTHFTPSQPPGVPQGNLPEGLYRFYIGDRGGYSSWSKCRKCGTPAYNNADRDAHKKKYNPSCCDVLVDAYKILLGKGDCVVCQKQTRNKRWGVPLCSDQCITTWKFEAFNRFSELEKAIHLVKSGYQDTDSTSSPIEQSRQLYPAGGS